MGAVVRFQAELVLGRNAEMARISSRRRRRSQPPGWWHAHGRDL